MSYFKATMHHLILAGAVPQIPLGELTALPQTPQLDFRDLLLREGRMGRKDGKEGQGRGERRESRVREGRGGEEGERRNGERGKRVGEGLRYGCWEGVDCMKFGKQV